MPWLSPLEPGFSDRLRPEIRNLRDEAGRVTDRSRVILTVVESNLLFTIALRQQRFGVTVWTKPGRGIRAGRDVEECVEVRQALAAASLLQVRRDAAILPAGASRPEPAA